MVHCQRAESDVATTLLLSADERAREESHSHDSAVLFHFSVRSFLLVSLPCLHYSTLAAFVGLVATAYLDGCDPLLSGRVRAKDQIVIYLAVAVLGKDTLLSPPTTKRLLGV